MPDNRGSWRFIAMVSLAIAAPMPIGCEAGDDLSVGSAAAKGGGCGNGRCGRGESCATCPSDCGGCTADGGSVADSGAPDTGAPDTGAADAGSADAGSDSGPAPCTPGSIACNIDVRPVSVGSLTVGTSKIYAAPLDTGGLVTTWVGSDAAIHVTQLDATGARTAPDFSVPGQAVHGLAVVPDGYAMLIRTSFQMSFVKVSTSGAVLLERVLVAGCVGGMSTGLGALPSATGRLLWTGTRYLAYFEIVSMTSTCGLSHSQDIIFYLEADASPVPPADTWPQWPNGCSHSLDQEIDISGTSVAKVCLSDCFPSKAILYFSRGGSNTVLSPEPSGDCLGTSSASLGSLVPVSDGFWVSYTSREGRASSDVGLIHMSLTGTPDSQIWLTGTASADETGTHLARYQGGLLAGWAVSGVYYLARLDSAGSMTGAPEVVSVQFAGTAGAQRNNFFNYSNGDAGWVWAWGSMNELKVVRVRN